MKAWEIYTGSDGEATKQFYVALQARGAVGVVAVNLFRAQKASSRAKVYRGGIRGKGSFRGMAYDRKNWSLQQLCAALVEHGAALGIQFGWKRDDGTPGFEECLYVDLPEHGQVSFHSAVRYAGPEYTGEWDGARSSAERIVAFCDRIFAICPSCGIRHQRLFEGQREGDGDAAQ